MIEVSNQSKVNMTKNDWEAMRSAWGIINGLGRQVWQYMDESIDWQNIKIFHTYIFTEFNLFKYTG